VEVGRRQPGDPGPAAQAPARPSALSLHRGTQPPPRRLPQEQGASPLSPRHPGPRHRRPSGRAALPALARRRPRQLASQRAGQERRAPGSGARRAGPRGAAGARQGPRRRLFCRSRKSRIRSREVTRDACSSASITSRSKSSRMHSMHPATSTARSGQTVSSSMASRSAGVGRIGGWPPAALAGPAARRRRSRGRPGPRRPCTPLPYAHPPRRIAVQLR